MTGDELRTLIAAENGTGIWRLSDADIVRLLERLESDEPDDFGDYGNDLAAALYELAERRGIAGPASAQLTHHPECSSQRGTGWCDCRGLPITLASLARRSPPADIRP